MQTTCPNCKKITDEQFCPDCKVPVTTTKETESKRGVGSGAGPALDHADLISTVSKVGPETPVEEKAPKKSLLGSPELIIVGIVLAAILFFILMNMNSVGGTGHSKSYNDGYQVAVDHLNHGGTLGNAIATYTKSEACATTWPNVVNDPNYAGDDQTEYMQGCIDAFTDYGY